MREKYKKVKKKPRDSQKRKRMEGQKMMRHLQPVRPEEQKKVLGQEEMKRKEHLKRNIVGLKMNMQENCVRKLKPEAASLSILQTLLDWSSH